MEQTEDWTRTRLLMALVGAAGGFSLWWLTAELPSLLGHDRLEMFLTLAVLSFFVHVMALTGPIQLSRALAPAAGVAVMIAGLTIWGSLRFASAADFIDAGHPMVALAMIYLVGTPFLSVMLEYGRGAWRDYAALFQTAWGILVRFAAAGLFTGVFWGVLYLSDALLSLVGIDAIERMIRVDAVPFVLTGTVLGLALAVAHEWKDYVSPHLLLRLLRLLVPMVVPVLALFLLAVFVTGLDEVLNFTSETATLTAVAIGCITLITVSVDRDGFHQVFAWPMRWGVKALAVMVVPLAVLAVWGIGVRVLAYGWTPERVLAALSVGMVMLYGLAYAPLVLWPGDWGARVRGVNIGMALLSLVLAVLWLTPILNAERLSAQSQLARIAAGRVAPENAALWEMAHRWGLPGRAALAQLSDVSDLPQRDRVLELAAKANAKASRYEYNDDQRQATAAEQAGQLAELIPLRPEGVGLPGGAFGKLPEYLIAQIRQGCSMTFEDGSPGCVYLEVAFRPDLQMQQGVILFRTANNRAEALAVRLNGDMLERDGDLRNLPDGRWVNLKALVIKRVLDGAYVIAPAQVNALHIGDLILFPDN